MRRFFISSFIIFVSMATFGQTPNTIFNYQQTSNSAQESNPIFEAKARELLSKMSLEEKVGQMAQITLDVVTKGEDIYSSYEPVELDVKQLQDAFIKYHVGSVLNTSNNVAMTKEKWTQLITEIQKYIIQNAKTKIPILYGVDAIHGPNYTQGATFFPQQIGMAATFNPTLVEQTAAMSAYEARASNIPWNFSPVLDLGRDPRFARIWETFGEDVYVVSEMGRAMIRGYQGKTTNGIASTHMAACLKHYLGYGASNSGKDRTPIYIPDNVLLEMHSTPFKAAMDAGARTIMINSGIINGIPVHANAKILTEMLRNTLGFKGMVVTDWADIDNLYTRDKIATSIKDAIRIGINAGIDMAMIPYDYTNFCKDLMSLVDEGKVSMARIDESVLRILTLKFELGLFDKPYYDVSEYPDFGSSDHEKLAYTAATESITLLKNKDNVLPMAQNKKILVVGPNANSMRTLNGGWTYSWQGEKTEMFAQRYNTILEAVQEKFGNGNVLYSDALTYRNEGKYFEEKVNSYADAIQKAKDVDYILLCIGENSYTEKRGDIPDLTISENQISLAQSLSKTGKPIIVVLSEGRPRVFNKIESIATAVLNIYLPGNFGGDALADILIGNVNPSGKLPYTYPKYPNSVYTYDFKPSDNQEKMTGAYDYETIDDIQYPFGYGLSYTQFSYSNLQIDKSTLNSTDSLKVSVDVTNTGNKIGKEVVMLYTRDHYASYITPDNRRLRRFTKIELKPSETKKVNFTLSPRDLAFVNTDNQWITEEGDFSVMIQKLEKTFNYSTK